MSNSAKPLVLSVAFQRIMLAQKRNQMITFRDITRSRISKWLSRAKELEARERHLLDLYQILKVPFGSDILAAIKRLMSSDEVWKRLEPIFMAHVGTRGHEGGAVDVFSRIILERDNAESALKRIKDACGWPEGASTPDEHIREIEKIARNVLLMNKVS